MLRLSVKVALGLLLLAPVALHAPHEVVVLAGGADPASVREIERRCPFLSGISFLHSQSRLLIFKHWEEGGSLSIEAATCLSLDNVAVVVVYYYVVHCLLITAKGFRVRSQTWCVRSKVLLLLHACFVDRRKLGPLRLERRFLLSTHWLRWRRVRLN